MYYLIIALAALCAILSLIVWRKDRQLDELSDKYCKAYTEAQTGKIVAKDLLRRIAELSKDRDYYKQACLKSDEIRKKLCEERVHG